VRTLRRHPVRGYLCPDCDRTLIVPPVTWTLAGKPASVQRPMWCPCGYQHVEACGECRGDGSLPESPLPCPVCNGTGTA
jgi:DnaJ-class molecular chaperone